MDKKTFTQKSHIGVAFLAGMLLAFIGGMFAMLPQHAHALAMAGAPSTIAQAADAPRCPDGMCIFKYINPLIKILGALVGVAVTISIVIGGIQYSSSGGDPSKVTAAKQRITKALVALAAFILLYVFMNWVLPGGTG